MRMDKPSLFMCIVFKIDDDYNEYDGMDDESEESEESEKSEESELFR